MGAGSKSREIWMGTGSSAVLSLLGVVQHLGVVWEPVESASYKRTKQAGFAVTASGFKLTPVFEYKLIYHFDICFNSVCFASA